MTVSAYVEHFRDRARRVLPEGAMVKAWDDHGDWILQTSWPLHPAVRGRRSRPVQIVISEEALEDYAAAGERARALADQRFDGFVRRHLATFDPNHDPAFAPLPPSRWVVTTRDLNG